jgi:hypothetical protein
VPITARLAPAKETETWLEPVELELPEPEVPELPLVARVEAEAEAPLAMSMPLPQPARTKRLQTKERVKRLTQEGIGKLHKVNSVVQ